VKTPQQTSADMQNRALQLARDELKIEKRISETLRAQLRKAGLEPEA